MDWIQVKLTYEVFNILERFIGIDHNSNKKLNIITELNLYLLYEDHINTI